MEKIQQSMFVKYGLVFINRKTETFKVAIRVIWQVFSVNKYSVSRKKETKILSIKLWWFWWNLATISWINFLQNHVNVFHLTWITSLHYLVKLEMLVEHMLPLSCNRQKLLNLSHLNCGPQIRQIWIHLITVCERILQEKVKKYDQSSRRTETETENGVGQDGSCRHCGSHLSVAPLIAPDQWWAFCTPPLAIFPTCCYQVDSNLANLKATVAVG